MAVPSSGQLRLRGDIALEVDGSATGSNVSLRTLSASAGKSTPDNMSEFYGYSASVPPTVTTGSSSSTNTSVYMTGTVNSDGGATITERGFYFGTSTNATSNPKYVVAGTTGNYNLNRTGLSTNTTYRYWAYAKNASGTTIGAMQTRATYPTLGYSWTYINQNNYQYIWNIKLTDAYGNGVTAHLYDASYFQHPYLGVIFYSTANTSYTGDYTGGWGNAQNTVGRLNVSGYNSTHTYYTRSQYSPSSWRTPDAQFYNDQDSFIALVHPSLSSLNSNSVISSSSWSAYCSTGYLYYSVDSENIYNHTGGYMSQGSQTTNMTVLGG